MVAVVREYLAAVVLGHYLPKFRKVFLAHA